MPLPRIAILTNHPLSAPLIAGLGERLESVPVAVMDQEALVRGALDLLGASPPLYPLSQSGLPWSEALARWLREIAVPPRRCRWARSWRWR
ncbi:MAG: hypothetical protein R6V45_09515 [Oceanipulchritudo sp.]